MLGHDADEAEVVGAGQRRCGNSTASSADAATPPAARLQLQASPRASPHPAAGWSEGGRLPEQCERPGPEAGAAAPVAGIASGASHGPAPPASPQWHAGETRASRPEDIDYEHIFSQKEAEIAAQRQRVQGLQALLQTIEQYQAEENFDEEDRQIVEQAFKSETDRLNAMEQEFGRRINCYETLVVKMKQRLDKRRRILETLDENTGVLQDNDRLREFFVMKQVNLLKLYNEICMQVAGMGHTDGHQTVANVPHCQAQHSHSHPHSTLHSHFHPCTHLNASRE
jgi:hypothetical protein